MLRTGREQKSSAPRCQAPETGCGRINAPHGTELYIDRWAQKMPTAMLANLVACFKCLTLQRWGFFSRKARDRAKKEIFRHISRRVSFTSSSRSKNRMRDFSKADVLRPSFACGTGNATVLFIFVTQLNETIYFERREGNKKVPLSRCVTP